ncbi:hypothetical protein [Exiguobacterium antarcticum]|uniref:hypothetical protein n=1 Tax=Exiguobacterium antarcticum TaxID=132920 RepID=UPI001F1726A6|nr:hypothetical protein [Exiguobacterium antarcticum]
MTSGSFTKQTKIVLLKEAWTGVWVGLAVIFGGRMLVSDFYENPVSISLSVLVISILYSFYRTKKDTSTDL